MTCARLVPAEKIQAFYSGAKRLLTISASVTFRPGNFEIAICRSLLDGAVLDSPAFVVTAPLSTVPQPDRVVTKTITASFEMAKPPKNVVVYSAGLDAPLRTTVSVGDTPAPMLAAVSAVKSLSSPPVAGLPSGQEATGWSKAYRFDDALADAVAQLRVELGGVNPDVGVHAVVVETGIQLGGFGAQTGFYVKLRVP